MSIDCDKITDWPTFYGEFAEAFGFPDFYGKNMDAWIDCLTYLDDPEAGMTTVRCDTGCIVVLELLNARSLRQRCPDLYDAVIEGAAFVNWRRLETDQPAVLAISFWT